MTLVSSRLPHAGREAARTSWPSECETGLADLLQDRTRSLHLKAERTGVVRDLVRGTANRRGYALYLRNLLPAYRELEQGLERRGEVATFAGLARKAVYRVPALIADLEGLCGQAWSARLPLLPAGQQYATRVRDAAREDHGVRLIAHAYTRYLGDLNGGQILRRLLVRSLGLGPDTLHFYEFTGVDDLGRCKAEYRSAIDRAGLGVQGREAVLEEACAAFRHNIDLSTAVQRACKAAATGRA